MARITMRNSQKATFAEVFEIYISAVTARGVKDKTIATYKQHFYAISKRLDVSLPINRLNSTILDNMILQMRKEGLSDSSINSYTRTLKCFLSWCNEAGYTKANLKIYKAAETVKETYSDEELLTLLAIHVPKELLGGSAVSLLLKQIASSDSQPATICMRIGTMLVLRDTVYDLRK